MSGYHLKNERLKVKIEIPGAHYQKSRFSWNTMISEVVLDGENTFCGRESLEEGKGTGGIGLWNEFGIEEPIGYDDAIVGEQFPKPGIGLLTKMRDEPYDFAEHYRISPFHFVIKKSVNEYELKIVSEPMECRGYAFRLTETVSLVANKMVIETCFENVGIKPIDTTEYRHNFLCINHHPIGKDYKVTYSYPFMPSEKVGEFEVNENTVSWRMAVKNVLYGRCDKPSDSNENQFKVEHIPSGVGVCEKDYFRLERAALWGMGHVISPETFIRISVKPGEEQTWIREYTFYNKTNK